MTRTPRVSRALRFIALLALSITCTAARSEYIDFDSGRREAIVFVHGVTGDARTTWTNPGSNAYWPQLIRNDPRFAAANVWVFNYVSPKLSSAQNVDELALKLGDALSPVLQSHDKLYFLVHSMGGLIVRQMLTKKAMSLEKIPMIYFFGTPSAGADSAGVAAAISRNPQYENLRPFTRESDVAGYARTWLATSEDPRTRYPQRIWSFCAYEIQGLVANLVVVTPLSASYLCSTEPRGSLANHSTMVKPKNSMDEPYQYFAAAYDFARSETAKLLASTSAISLHTAQSPGIDVASLRLQFATIKGSLLAVDCGQSREGSIAIRDKSIVFGKVLAAEAFSPTVTNLRAAQFEPKIEKDGALFLKYSLKGLESDPILGCPKGSASVGLQYVIEVKQ